MGVWDLDGTAWVVLLHSCIDCTCSCRMGGWGRVGRGGDGWDVRIEEESDNLHDIAIESARKIYIYVA